MASIVEQLQQIDWEIQNLHRSFFAGRRNKGRDRRIDLLLKQRSDIYKVMYPSKHKR